METTKHAGLADTGEPRRTPFTKDLPRIGMGCWAIGGPFWNGETAVGYAGTSDAASRAALQASWDAGVRVFDTSAVYGAGHSEMLIGEELGGRPDAVIVSKFGHSFDARTKQMLGARFDPESIVTSIDESRRRLRRDAVDVMLLHLNELSVANAAAVFDTLEELRARGWIGAYGWSTDFPASVDTFADCDGFVGVQHAMNVLIDAPSMTAVAQRHGLTQMIRSPLAMGLLTGTYAGGRRIEKDDVRNHSQGWNDYFKDRTASPKYAEQITTLRDLLTVDGRTLAQGALCWLLAKSPTALPLPGAKNARQAEENAAAMAHGPLPAPVMAEIEAVLDRPPEGSPRAR